MSLKIQEPKRGWAGDVLSGGGGGEDEEGERPNASMGLFLLLCKSLNMQMIK